MEMLAHNPVLATQHGMSTQKAQEYVSENKGNKSYKNLPKFHKLKKLLGK